MKISAVVPIYNDKDVIEECLQSLLNQTKKFDEIIVVDDGSTDDALKIIRKYPVKIIQTEHGERSHARNIGWKNASGDIIAFIESDSVYDEKWVEKVAEGFERGADAVIDRRTLYEPRTFIARFNAEMFDFRYRNYKPFSAWAFKKDVLEELGGFDENLKAAEDVDMGDRLIDNGYKIGFAKEAVQYHKGEPKTLKETIKRSWWFGKHMHAYYRKHPKKRPYHKFGLYTVLTLLLFIPKIFIITVSAMYLILLFRMLIRGLPLKYASIYPILSIINGWVFYGGYIAGLLSRKKKYVNPRRASR